MAEKNQPTLLELMDAVPPFMAYALAYDPAKPTWREWIGLDKFVKISGLPSRTVVRVASKISWNGVKLEVAAAFLKACGIASGHPLNMRKKHKYMKLTMGSHNPFPYLSATQWRTFEKRCAAWKKARANKL